MARKRSAELPSRKQILDFIATSDQPAGKREIARAFGIRGDAKIQLKKLLNDMERKAGAKVNVIQSRLYRLISVFKVREGPFDPAIREFTITDTGIVVGEPFEGVEAVLSGMAGEAVRTASLVRPAGGGVEIFADPSGPPG